MSTESPAERLRQQYELLEWGNQAITRQPTAIRAAIERAALAITDALAHTTYQFTLDLPREIVSDSLQVVRLTKPLSIRAGSWLNRVRHKSCQDTLLNTLVALSESSDPTVAQIVRLVNYYAAKMILEDRLPITESIPMMRAFDHKKQRVCMTDEEAVTIVAWLGYYVDQLHLMERLYEGWMASDVYTEKSATLLRQVTEQGRALAYMQTMRLIEALKQAWQQGTIGGGLTVFIPYMDEHTYQLNKFRVEVMPNARIPFRPDFVVSACRLAEREVRQNPRYAQATRWQLLAQLDLITQAFDAKPDTEPSNR